MTVLGPGAVCCGDPTDCAVDCDQKELLLKQPKKKPTKKAPAKKAAAKEGDDE